MTHWEECWRFNTANFAVVLELAPCEDDPADSFQFDEDIEAVRNGSVDWFDARIRVLYDNREVGSDYLCCCAYAPARDFWTAHRKHKQRDYFGDMVRMAIAQARAHLAHVPHMRINGR